MRHVNIKFIVLALSCSALLGGCSGTKEQLGLTRQAPNEFAVVRRAPLEMPPEYSLRPPRPGAERPQEVRPEEQAKQTVFGQKNASHAAKPTSSEEVLLQKTGGDQADPNIRQLVDQERAATAKSDKPVVDRLLGIVGAEKEGASIVDARAEAERLQKNKEEGKPVTEGETPTVEN